jgi:pentatricopeptide repeat protein
MYAKFGKLRGARLVMDRVVEKDVVLFTALIVGYNQHGEEGEALQVFGKMINEGVKANEFTTASILISCGNLKDSNGKLVHGLAMKSGFESAVASQTSLLTMYSRCGLIIDSLKVFKRFSNPNQVTWTSLMVGLVQNGGEGIALTKFRQMIRSSIIPNSFTLSTALQACSKLAKLEEGRQIHDIATKLNLDRDKYVSVALIDMYGKCGNTEMARSVFDALIEFDVVSVNSMICSYAKNGFAYEALELLNTMKDLGLEPNDVTFLNVQLACNNAGLVEEGCRIFAIIRDNQNIELSTDHYASMVDLLGRSGRLEEAEMLIEHVKDPDVVLWRILLSACKIHGAVDMAERVVNRALEFAPEDERTHALLSKHYASCGNWNQFIEVKSAMKDMKSKKISAMSSVDIDKDVHTSKAEDWSHQRRKKIAEMLEELIEKVKK